MNSHRSRARQSARGARTLTLIVGLFLGVTVLAGRLAPRPLLAAPPAQAATPQPPPAAPSEDLNRVRRNGTMLVGTSADYAPFAFYNSNFALDGFDIQLMDAIGTELGVDVEFKTFAFAGVLDALRLGQVDAAISAISITPERQAIADFSNIYYIDDSAALVRTDAGFTIRRASDFAGRKVAVETGATHQSWAQQRLVNTGIIRQQDLLSMDSVNDAITALRSGVVDIVLLGALSAAALDERYPDVKRGGAGFNTQQYAIAVRKGSNLLGPINRALISVQVDGRYGNLVQQYLGENAPAPPPTGDTGLIPVPPAPTARPTTTPPATAPVAPTDAPTPTPLPTVTATVIALPPTATASPTAAPCVYSSAFVEDLTFDDQNMTAPPKLIPGLSFARTWRILNSGNCAWQPDFALFYVSGNRPEASMDGRPVPVGRVVLPGQTVDLTANLVAPSTYGIFQGFWQMRNNLGNFFGETVWVGIQLPNPSPPTPTPPPPPVAPTPAPQPTAQPTPAGWTGNPNLRADNQFISPGQCTNIRWDVDDVAAVFFVDGGNVMGKGGHDSQPVCPSATQTYELRVLTRENVTQAFFSTISVAGAPPPPPFTINFWADRTEIRRGECTTLRWDVQGVRAVFYQDQGVSGVSSKQECPGSDRTYRLRVVRLDDVEERCDVFVRVIQNSGGGGGGWTPDE